MTNLKGAISQVPKVVGEAIVKPLQEQATQAVQDVRESIEGTPQSAADPAPKPQSQSPQKPTDIQDYAKAKQTEDRQKIFNIRKTLNLYNDSYQRNQQLVNQKAQVEKQQTKEDDEKGKIIQFDLQKKQASIATQRAQRKVEIKKSAA